MVLIYYGVGLNALISWIHPDVSCAVTFGEWGKTVLRRSARTAWTMWACLYLYHLATWFALFNLKFEFLFIAPFLFLLSVMSKKEIVVWAGALGAMVVSAMAPSEVSISAFLTGSAVAPFEVRITAFITGIVLGLKARQTQQYRFNVGAVLAFYFAVWSSGFEIFGMLAFNLLLNFLTAAILLWMAWRMRLLSAFLVAVILILLASRAFAPQTTLQWGIAILSMGFIALLAGVAINWSQRKTKQQQNQ